MAERGVRKKSGEKIRDGQADGICWVGSNQPCPIQPVWILFHSKSKQPKHSEFQFFYMMSDLYELAKPPESDGSGLKTFFPDLCTSKLIEIDSNENI